MTIEELYGIYQQYPSIQTDTRKLQENDLFFALPGPNFNGNEFAAQALAAGASYAIVDEDPGTSNDRIIRVENVLKTLQDLALHHRRRFKIPFIAITGSNGKTTTKELVSAVLSAEYITYTTQGNLNNHIGIPLTLLRVRNNAEIAVIEMGANHQLEIEGYCKYVLPTHGIITNVGKAHLEGFGGIEGVKKGKGELFDFLRNNDGTAFIFNDYDYLKEMSAGIPVVHTYGTHDAFITGHTLSSEPFLKVKITSDFVLDVIDTHLVGEYNLPNVLCAVTIGKFFNVPAGKLKTAIQSYAPTNSRSQLIKSGSNTFIADAYNANPASIKAAIENFSKIPADDKILMLGGMMELGNESLDEHKRIIDLIGLYTWNKVVLVGGDFSKVIHPYLFFQSSEDARRWLKQQHFEHTWFLIKGSRSMQMEKVLE